MIKITSGIIAAEEIKAGQPIRLDQDGKANPVDVPPVFPIVFSESDEIFIRLLSGTIVSISKAGLEYWVGRLLTEVEDE